MTGWALGMRGLEWSALFLCRTAGLLPHANTLTRTSTTGKGEMSEEWGGEGGRGPEGGLGGGITTSNVFSIECVLYRMCSL